MKKNSNKTNGFNTIKEGYDWLHRIDDIELKCWLMISIKTGMFFPLPLMNRSQPSETLCSLIKCHIEEKDLILFERIKNTIAEIFKELNCDDINNYDYITELIMIISELDISKAYPYLIDISRKKIFFGKRNSFGEEMQQLILKSVLFNKRIADNEISGLCKELLRYEDYTLLARRKLKEIEKPV